MHVAFVVRAMSRGGIARQVTYLSAGLRDRGHRVSLIQFFQTSADDELADTGVERHTLGVRSQRDVLGLAHRFLGRLRVLRPDVLYGFYIESNLLALLGGRPMRSRVVWGLRFDHLESLEPDLVGRAAAMAHARLLGRADLVIANSHAGARAALAKGLRPSRLQVIVNGVDTSRFRPDPALRGRARNEWGVSDGTILIGAVGRLEPRKGHDHFLHAAALHGREFPEVRFVLVGPGDESERSRLAQIAGDHGISERVIWAGARTDMPAVYNALDLTTLLSNRSEGCPNVVAESLACGVPCVVSDVGDAAVLVSDPRAVVTSPGEAEVVAEAWTRTLRGWTPDAASKARRRIESELGLTRLVDETEGALQSLL